MRTLDQAIVYARSRAPLEKLSVLHLSHVGLTELFGLEKCLELQILYATHNKLSTLTGLDTLLFLWQCDFSYNILSDLTPLLSFSMLGYLALGHNISLTYTDISTLRDIHIIELELNDNPFLCHSNSNSDVEEYRKMVITLLPHVWILDGHFVSSGERTDAYASCHEIASSYPPKGCRFGSTSGTWNNPTGWGHSSLHAKWKTIIEELPTRGDVIDGYRLRHLALDYHPNFCGLHNDNLPTSKPKNASPHVSFFRKAELHLHQVSLLSFRTRLDVCILLHAAEEYSIPRDILTEALTIHLAGTEGNYTSWIADWTRLSEYALTTFLFHFRQLAMEAQQSELVQNRPNSNDMILWNSMDTVYKTLLKKNKKISVDKSSSRRALHATILLSKSPSFPNMLNRNMNEKMRKVFMQLQPLLKASKMTDQDLFYDTLQNDAEEEEMDGNVRYQKRVWYARKDVVEKQAKGAASQLPWNVSDLPREYLRPWVGEVATRSTDDVVSQAGEKQHPALHIAPLIRNVPQKLKPSKNPVSSSTHGRHTRPTRDHDKKKGRAICSCCQAYL